MTMTEVAQLQAELVQCLRVLAESTANLNRATPEIERLRAVAGAKPERAELVELANRWVDMAQRQTDRAPALYSARAEGTSEALRMCALMLRELLLEHVR